MFRILFLGATAYLAVRYIMHSNKKQQKLLEEKRGKPALESPTIEAQTVETKSDV